ncbi:MAG: phytanoyl-CoA dioxygenase family protein [Woeseiaceae bacterium]
MTDSEFDVLKADYDRDGFVVMRSYLPDTEVDELRARAVPLADTLMKKQDNEGRYRNLFKSINRYDEWFDNLLSGGKHVPLLRYLLNDEVFGASAAWFDRPEGEAQGVEPHVDAVGGDRSPDAGATIWFALDPVSVGNGCVHYLRGSHKDRYPDVIPIPGINTESEDVFAAELEPGDAVIHNALTVHWSGGNETGKPRRAVSCFYFSARAHAQRQQQKTA